MSFAQMNFHHHHCSDDVDPRMQWFNLLGKVNFFFFERLYRAARFYFNLLEGPHLHVLVKHNWTSCLKNVNVSG